MYLLKHFEKINDIKKLMSSFHEKYPQINWLINHSVKYEGNENFIIKQKYKLIGYDDNNVIICYLKPQFNKLNYNEVLINSIFDTYLINNVNKFKNNEITENYKRFHNKKIITCIFTLDRNEPYYIDWYDSLEKNTEVIKNRIYFNIMERYKLESNNIFYFYSYWRMYCPDNEKKPSDFIRFLKETYHKIKNTNLPKSMPKYVDDFFSQIEFEIETSKGKSKKELILTNYDNKDYFVEKIEKKLDINVKRYLGITISDDDEEDYE
jgi:hypothetical protein